MIDKPKMGRPKKSIDIIKLLRLLSNPKMTLSSVAHHFGLHRNTLYARLKVDSEFREFVGRHVHADSIIGGYLMKPGKKTTTTEVARSARKRRSIEDRYILYDTADECADAAAPIFAQHRWRWDRCGIPSRSDIADALLSLANDYERWKHTTSLVESGRLICYKGRFGHERPR